MKKVISIIIIMLFVMFLINSFNVKSYYKITVNPVGENLTNLTISLVPSDINLTGTSLKVYTNSSLLPYWLQPNLNGSIAKVWVKIPYLNASTPYVFYISNESGYSPNGSKVFKIFDDFNNGSISLKYDANNPVLTGNVSWENNIVTETSVFKDNGTYIMWYRGNSGTTSGLGYATSTDGRHWIKYSGNPLLTGYALFYVVNYENQYFLFAKNMTDGNLYLFNITNHTNPIMMNSGKPVYTHSSDPNAWDYEIFNPGVAVDSHGVWHMLLEGKSSTSNFQIGYAYSNLTEMNWSAHRSSSAVIPLSGNPDLLYLPNENVLLSIRGDISGSYWKIVASYAYLGTNLSNASNWKTVSTSKFVISAPNIHVADPSVMTNFNTSYPVMISYGYNQNVIYQAYYSQTIDSFFNNLLHNGTYNLSSIWNGDTSYASINNNILTFTGDTTWTHIYSNNYLNNSYELYMQAKLDAQYAEVGAEPNPCCDARVVLYNTGLIVSNNTGNSLVTSGDWNLNNWYNFRIIKNENKFVSLYVNNTLKENITTNIGTLSIPAVVAAYYSSSTQATHVNYIFARQYAPLPSYSVSYVTSSTNTTVNTTTSSSNLTRLINVSVFSPTYQLLNNVNVSAVCVNESTNTTIKLSNLSLNGTVLFNLTPFNFTGECNITADGSNINYDNSSNVINVTTNLTQTSFILYPFQYFYVKDYYDNDLLNNFNILFTYNNATYINYTVTNGIYVISLRKIELGLNVINVISPLFVSNTTELNFTNSSQYNYTFYINENRLKLTPSNELTGGYIYNYSLTFYNTTQIKQLSNTQKLVSVVNESAFINPSYVADNNLSTFVYGVPYERGDLIFESAYLNLTSSPLSTLKFVMKYWANTSYTTLKVYVYNYLNNTFDFINSYSGTPVNGSTTIITLNNVSAYWKNGTVKFKIHYDTEYTSALKLYGIIPYYLTNTSLIIPSSLLPKNQNTLTVSSNGYVSRHYLINPNNNYDLTSYLLPVGNGVYYTIYVYNSAGTPLQNAQVIIEKIINGKWVTISSQLTDASGKAVIYLDMTNPNYKLIVMDNGYVDINTPLSIDINNPLTYVVLQALGASGSNYINFLTPFTNISYSVTPNASQQYFKNNLSYSFTIYDGNNNLQYYGIRVYNISNNHYTSIKNITIYGYPSGGVVNWSINQTGSYKITPFFKRGNESETVLDSNIYIVYYNSGLGLFDLSSSINPFLWWLIILITVTTAFIFISRFNVVGAGAVGLIVMGFMLVIYPAPIFGMSPWIIYTIIALVYLFVEFRMVS